MLAVKDKEPMNHRHRISNLHTHILCQRTSWAIEKNIPTYFRQTDQYILKINKYVIIKKGEHGALLFHENKIFCAPGLPLEEVFDPTGAGDSFIGGFIAYLSQRGKVSFEDMKTAVIIGSALASFTVQEFGTKALEKMSFKELSERIQTFKRLTEFEIELT